MNRIRALRLNAKASQAAFAKRLGVPLETFRMWDSGRRMPPLGILAAARALSAVEPDDQLLPLAVLARLVGVSVFRLREAARDGRLTVVYERRVVFGHPIPRATRAAAEVYKTQFYGKKARWVARPVRPSLPPPPSNYPELIVGLRLRLRVSQAALATRIGAAGKAVVYQWEARKRIPSPLLWRALLDLGADGNDKARGRRAESVDQDAPTAGVEPA